VRFGGDGCGQLALSTAGFDEFVAESAKLPQLFAYEFGQTLVDVNGFAIIVQSRTGRTAAVLNLFSK